MNRWPNSGLSWSPGHTGELGMKGNGHRKLTGTRGMEGAVWERCLGRISKEGLEG